MFPLLKKDGLVVAYIGALLMWTAITWPSQAREPRPKSRVSVRRMRPRKGGPGTRRGGRGWGESGGWQRVVVGVVFVLAGGVHVAQVVWTPPERYPFILDYLFVTIGFVHFAGVALYLNWKQWQTPVPAGEVLKED